MAQIRIRGVKKGNRNYTVHIALADTQEVDGELQEIPIGEAFVPIPHDLGMDDIRGKLLDAAERIWDAHQDAINKRKDIEEIVFPEIGVKIP